MQEPDRLGPVDPKWRLVEIGVRPLQSGAGGGDEVSTLKSHESISVPDVGLRCYRCFNEETAATTGVDFDNTLQPVTGSDAEGETWRQKKPQRTDLRDHCPDRETAVPEEE